MAMNRYQGNSGRMQRVPEHDDEKGTEVFYRPRQGGQPVVSARPPRLQKKESHGGLGFLEGAESSLKDKLSDALVKLTQLETEDYILLLILYLMYRESRDEQYLIIMGLMLFL